MQQDATAPNQKTRAKPRLRRSAVGCVAQPENGATIPNARWKARWPVRDLRVLPSTYLAPWRSSVISGKFMHSKNDAGAEGITHLHFADDFPLLDTPGW